MAIVFELQIDVPDNDPKVVLITEILTRAMSGLAMDGVDSGLSIRKYDDEDCTCGEDHSVEGRSADDEGPPDPAGSC